MTEFRLVGTLGVSAYTSIYGTSKDDAYKKLLDSDRTLWTSIQSNNGDSEYDSWYTETIDAMVDNSNVDINSCEKLPNGMYQFSTVVRMSMFTKVEAETTDEAVEIAENDVELMMVDSVFDIYGEEHWTVCELDGMVYDVKIYEDEKV